MEEDISQVVFCHLRENHARQQLVYTQPYATGENTFKLEVFRFAGDAFRLVRSCLHLNNHNFLELLGLFAGVKRVVRLVATEETYPLIAEFCQRSGLLQAHSKKKQAPKTRAATGDTFTVSVDWDDPTGKYFVAIIGQNYNAVDSALNCEDRDVSYQAFGELYEYPACCTEAYVDLMAGEEWVSAYLRRSPLGEDGSLYSNRLATLFDGSTLIPDFFPCRLSCERAKGIGKRYKALLESIAWHEYLSQTEASLSTPILVRSGALIQLRGSKRSGQLISCDQDRMRQLAWKGLLTEDDPFWSADSLSVPDGHLRLFLNGRVLADEPTDLFNNRLLLFE